MPDSTRDAEIEALAEVLFASEGNASVREADSKTPGHDGHSFWPWLEAEKFINNRDQWRERRAEG